MLEIEGGDELGERESGEAAGSSPGASQQSAALEAAWRDALVNAVATAPARSAPGPHTLAWLAHISGGATSAAGAASHHTMVQYLKSLQPPEQYVLYGGDQLDLLRQAGRQAESQPPKSWGFSKRLLSENGMTFAFAGMLLQSMRNLLLMDMQALNRPTVACWGAIEAIFQLPS